MFAGRDGRKIIIAYESTEEAIGERSCKACMAYNDIIPCRFYENCRAEKSKYDKPVMFVQADRQVIERRKTGVSKNVRLERIHIYG